MSDFIYFATKLLNLTDDEVKQRYYENDAVKEGAADEVLGAISKKIMDAKTESQQNFDKGFQKAEAKYKTAAEKAFAEKTGVDYSDGRTLDEMIEEYAERNRKKSLTDADIKTHPLYRDLEKSSVKVEEYNKLKQEHEQFVTNFQRKSLLDQVKPKVWGIVSSMNPILEQNPKVAETRKNLFLSTFDSYDYQIEGDDVIVMKDGNRIEDQFKNPLKFDEFVKSHAADYFEFSKQEPKGGAGNNGGGNGSGSGFDIPMPKSIDEFNQTRAKLSGEKMVKYGALGREHLQKLGLM